MNDEEIFDEENADDLTTDAAEVLGDTLIELTDEDGNPCEFQILDIIEHRGSTYLVLIDAEDEAEELSEVLILREVEDELDDELSAYVAVEDDESHEVFGVFKRRNADLYNFVDWDGRTS